MRDTHALYVTAYFKETQTARIHVGQPVTIYVDAYWFVKADTTEATKDACRAALRSTAKSGEVANV
jgi:multidrug resistance efflux pump